MDYLQNGRRVLLLERDLSQPDRIVGELLQPGGYLMLKRLGLAHVLDNIDAQKVRLPARHIALLLWAVACAIGYCGTPWDRYLPLH